MSAVITVLLWLLVGSVGLAVVIYLAVLALTLYVALKK